MIYGLSLILLFLREVPLFSVERAIFFGVAIHDIKDGGSGAVSSRYLAVAVYDYALLDHGVAVGAIYWWRSSFEV